MLSALYPHPSHRPNRLNSRRTHSRPGFSSRSRSLPLSGRLVNDDPLEDRGRAIDSVFTLGGDVDIGSRTDGLGCVPPYEEVGTCTACELGAAGEADEDEVGRDRRYHPPLYVSATSWCSTGSMRPGSSWSSGATWIQPTTHFSSSTTSAVGDLAGPAEMEMCAAWDGIRYCAYDHSESKYLGSGKNGANGEKVDCRLLYVRAWQSAS